MRKFQSTAAQTAMLMAILTLGSKCIGFAREMVIANFYGTGVVTDSYVMAQSIPSMILGGVFSAVAISYMPVFSKKYELQGEEEANLFTSHALNMLVLVSGFAMIFGLIFSEQIVNVCAPQFSGERLELTSFYLKITFSFIIFNSVITLLEAFLQYKGVFLPQIILGYTQSASIIIVTIISAYTSYRYLAWGVFLGAFIRMLGSVVLAKRKNFHYTPDFHFGNSTKEIFILAMPIFIGGSISQINAFIDKMLASGLSIGAVSALNYANLIVNMIMTVTTSILVTLVYPKLTQAYALKDYDRISAMIEKGMNITFIIATPCTLGAMAYSEQVIQVVYERGAFDAASTALTGPAFLWYSAGIIFQAIALLLTKLYYSMGDTKTPVKYAAIGVGLNVVLNLSLIGVMQQGGLALATSAAAALNAFLLYKGIKRQYPQIQLLKSKRKAIKIIFSAGLSVGISLLFYWGVGAYVWMPRLILFALAVGVAGICYLTLLYLCKIEELSVIKDLFHRGE